MKKAYCSLWQKCNDVQRSQSVIYYKFLRLKEFFTKRILNILDHYSASANARYFFFRERERDWSLCHFKTISKTMVNVTFWCRASSIERARRKSWTFLEMFEELAVSWRRTKRRRGMGRKREEKSVATGVRMKVHVFFLRRNTLLPLVSAAVMEGAPATLEELIRG